MSIDLKNKKLLKEWEKIKDSDIFASFEDFAEFYYTTKSNTRSCGCLSQRIISEIKSIKQTHPEILAYWDYEKILFPTPV